MSQNYKAMSRKQQLFRIYEGYSALLKNAQQHRDFIIARASSLTPDKYQLLLKNAETDIAFARVKLDSMVPAIPVQFEAKPIQAMPLHAYPQGEGSQGLTKQAAFTPHGSQAQHAPEVPEVVSEQSPVPFEAQSGAMSETEHSGSLGWAVAAIAGIVGFSIGAPLFIEWINKDPQKNLAYVRDFLNGFKNA